MEGFWRTTPVGVIRKRSWKLLESFQLRGSANRWEFDDLQNDIGERVNLARENTYKVMELLQDLGSGVKPWPQRFRKDRIPCMIHALSQTEWLQTRVGNRFQRQGRRRPPA